MAEKIKIAELEIDDKAFIKSTSDIKTQLDLVKATQRELAKATKDLAVEQNKLFQEGKEGTKAYKDNENALNRLNKEVAVNDSKVKSLSSSYNANVKVLTERVNAIADAETRQNALNLALNQEVTSIKEARESNKLLNKLRNEANALTAEGQKEIEALNNALDANNEFIKENADGYLKQKINIGNYTDSINDAFGGLGNFIAKSKEAGGVLPLLGTTIKTVSSSVLGLTKSVLTFLATPIGVVIALIAAGFLLVKNAMNRSEEATNKITKVFSVFGGIANKVLSALEPLGEFLIDVIVDSFELVGEAAEGALSIVSGALSLLGFEDAAKGVDSFTSSMKAGIKNAQDLADAEALLKKQQRDTAISVKELQIAQENLRQIRDDESLSIAERSKANDELALKLKEQQALELQTAETAVKAARLNIIATGQTEEAKDRLNNALLEVADITERINGIESEQLTNRVALQKEAVQKAKEYQDKLKQIADKAIAEQEAQLQKFIQSQGVRKKSFEEQVKFEQEVYDKEKAILEANLKNRNLTQTEYDAELLALQNELLSSKNDLIQTEYQRELDLFISKNQSKIDSEQFFSEESLRIEQERINSIAEKQKEFQQQQFDLGLINKQEYNDAIDLIDEETRLKREEAQVLRDEAQKEQDVLNAENQRLLDEEKFQSKLELDLFRLEQQRLQEVENAEKLGAETTLINERYANAKKEIEQEAANSKLQVNASVAGQIAGLLGEESALGKAAALVQAGINVQQGITAGVKLGFPAAIPAVAAAASVGFKAVSKIAGTTTKFEQGGIQEIGGQRHSNGGTKFYGEDGTTFEAESGEGIGILNRSAFKGFLAFNNSFNSGNSANGKFAGGGVITQAVRPQNNTQDFNELFKSISNMKVQVAVEDINTGQGNYAEVVNRANV